MNPPHDIPQRILLVRPSALGDVARTVPCLASLRHAYPDARIEWVVNDVFKQAIAAHPALDELIEFPRSRFKKIGRSISVTREALAWARDLRRRRYDLVIDLQGLARSGLITRITGAPRRVGMAGARELAWLGYNYRYQVDDRTHTVHKMMGLIECLGVPPVYDMRLYTVGHDRVWADEVFQKNGLTPGGYAVIAPTARWKSKCWPAERFAQVMERLGEVGIERAIVIGTQGEREQARPVLDGFDPAELPPVDMVGRTSVGQMMALIEHAGLVLCNDSAALHIAVGFGRRIVTIFGPTDPAFVGPFRYDSSVVRAKSGEMTHYRSAGDDDRLIATVTVDQVMERLGAIMATDPPDPEPAFVHRS